MRPPIPTTLPTAECGNRSEAMVKMFAEKPWCAAPARPTSPTTTHRLLVKGAYSTGSTHSAQISMANLREAFTLLPRPIIAEESHPPATLPTQQQAYTTTIGALDLLSVRWNVLWK